MQSGAQREHQIKPTEVKAIQTVLWWRNFGEGETKL